LFLQDHLISSQLFVLFVFVFVEATEREFLPLTLRPAGFLPFRFEKLLKETFCEVEFWEVLQIEKVRGFL